MLFKFLVRRCRDDNLAEDLVQDTLLRAARYQVRLTSRARLRAWIVQIAANLFRDHLRRHHRRPLVGCDEEVFEAVEDPAPGPGVALGEPVLVSGEPLEHDLALAHLREAFAGLVDHDRSVLTSFYGGRQSTHQTARECGIPPALVKVRLFRARRRLQWALLRRATLLRRVGDA